MNIFIVPISHAGEQQKKERNPEVGGSVYCLLISFKVLWVMKLKATPLVILLLVSGTSKIQLVVHTLFHCSKTFVIYGMFPQYWWQFTDECGP